MERMWMSVHHLLMRIVVWSSSKVLVCEHWWWHWERNEHWALELSSEILRYGSFLHLFIDIVLFFSVMISQINRFIFIEVLNKRFFRSQSQSIFSFFTLWKANETEIGLQCRKFGITRSCLSHSNWCDDSEFRENFFKFDISDVFPEVLGKKVGLIEDVRKGFSQFLHTSLFFLGISRIKLFWPIFIYKRFVLKNFRWIYWKGPFHSIPTCISQLLGLF